MTNPLPRTNTAYAYDATTGEYTGPVTVYLSELEGRYPLPPNTVATVPAPPAGLYQRHRLSPTSASWELVPDYRGVMLYSTDTAAPVANTLALGDALPQGYTTRSQSRSSPATTAATCGTRHVQVGVQIRTTAPRWCGRKPPARSHRAWPPASRCRDS